MTIRPLVIDKLIKILINRGKELYLKGYVIGNGGNLSAFINNHIIIKKSGESLGKLSPSSFVLVHISLDHAPEASIDYKIHREIYLNTSSTYVIHAHPSYLIKYTIINGNKTYFIPQDFETKYHLGEKIPIISGKHMHIHGKIGRLAKKYNLIIEKGHGIYIHGTNLDELVFHLERIEAAAKIIVHK
jgi:L-fuculose-phosphate aldolase